jgi:hypothetical protein
MNYVRILIERDPMTKVPRDVFPWEVPLYEAKFGDAESGASSIEVMGDATDGAGEPIALGEMPDAQQEFQRLRNAFGADADRRMSYVELAYGVASAGVKALGREIAEAYGVEVEKPKSTAKGRAAKVQQALESDPLADE